MTQYQGMALGEQATRRLKMQNMLMVHLNSVGVAKLKEFGISSLKSHSAQSSDDACFKPLESVFSKDIIDALRQEYILWVPGVRVGAAVDEKELIDVSAGGRASKRLKLEAPRSISEGNMEGARAFRYIELFAGIVHI